MTTTTIASVTTSDLSQVALVAFVAGLCWTFGGLVAGFVWSALAALWNRRS